MTRRSPAVLALAFVAGGLAGCASLRDHGNVERAAPAEDRTHMRLAPAVPGREQRLTGRQEFATFGIELPRGWRKVMSEPPREPGAPMIVRFEGPDHAYLHVEVAAPGHGVSADAGWQCAIADDGTLVLREEPRCTVPPGVEPEEEGCSGGDGRLDVFARCDAHAFTFGNTGAEDGVDLEPFREILRTVRVKQPGRSAPSR